MPAVVDQFLTARHRGDAYNCLHFSAEVWEAETGEDLRDRLGGMLANATRHRRVVRDRVRTFEKLGRPQSPCLVSMHRHRGEPHIGVYLRGRVLHLADHGAEFTELEVATRGFDRVRFYR